VQRTCQGVRDEKQLVFCVVGSCMGEKEPGVGIMVFVFVFVLGLQSCCFIKFVALCGLVF